jgi:hypothetical protein
MDNFAQALYALKRQKMAVERTLGARSTEECMVASRWVSAWQKLVQARLERTPGAWGGSRYVHPRTGQLLH